MCLREKRRLAPLQVDVVGNGVDNELFHPQDRAAARQALGHGSDGRRWLLFVGRVEEAKGALDLCRAFARSQSAADGRATLVMVGNGKAMGACQEATRSLGCICRSGNRCHCSGTRSWRQSWMG